MAWRSLNNPYTLLRQEALYHPDEETMHNAEERSSSKKREKHGRNHPVLNSLIHHVILDTVSGLMYYVESTYHTFGTSVNLRAFGGVQSKKRLYR